ncbi:MAG TPA: heparan-alpha-glucosaminide N-acetyltransferase domain-containing protein, partial [Gemmataceae bacterium]|nr:heparan-alpha-glucosaminide N-acetyltransferase domain-containing protein [Gemmataceae bacterium]
MPASPSARPDRLEAVDMLRGLVMVIMALDHVRDFFSNRIHMDPTNLNTTTWEIFLTRWITHYCAPTFIFLAGTGAYLSLARGRTKSQLAWFLFTRGVWLAFFEVVINRFMWMFNFDFVHHGAGVFWAIGLSMVGLSVLVFLPTSIVALFGIAMILFHNMLDGLTAVDVRMPEWLWVILHRPGDAVFARVTLPPGDLMLWKLRSAFRAGDPPGVRELTFGTGYCLI